MSRKSTSYARKRARQAAKVDRFTAFRAIASTAAAQSTADLDPDQLRDLRIGYHGALTAITSGTANDSEVHALALASNVSLLLCEHGIGHEYLDDVIAAQHAVVSIKARRDRVGRYGATGPELARLQTLLDLHDQQLDSEDCKEYVLIGALVECKRRAAAGHVFGVAA